MKNLKFNHRINTFHAIGKHFILDVFHFDSIEITCASMTVSELSSMSRNSLTSALFTRIWQGKTLFAFAAILNALPLFIK